MPLDDVNWANVEGLRAAADRIETAGKKFSALFNDMNDKIGSMIVDPATFGDDKSGREFFAAWEPYVRRWHDGVRGVADNILVTATGVDDMASAVAQADKDTARMADDLYDNIANGTTPGNRATGAGSGASGIPPLSPPPAPGSGGGGNVGGGHGGRH